MYTGVSRVHHILGMDGLSLPCDHTPTEFSVTIAQLQQGFDRTEAEQHTLTLSNNYSFVGGGYCRLRESDPYQMLDLPVASQFVNNGRNGICGIYIDY